MGAGSHKQFEVMCVINLAGEYEDFLESLQLQNRLQSQEPRHREAKKAIPFENSFYESPAKGKADWSRGGANSNRKEPKGHETYVSKQGSGRKSPASNKYSPQQQNTFRKTNKWDEGHKDVSTKQWQAEDDEW